MSKQQTTNPDPPASALPLTFDAWAELSARLLNLDKEARLDMLFEQEVTPADFARCDAHYVLELGRDLAQGRKERMDRYAHVCVEEMKRRKAAPPAPETLTKAEASTAPAEPEPEAATPAQAGATEVPSFLQEHATSAPQVPDVGPAPRPALHVPPRELASTSAAFELPTAFRTGALPFSKTAAPSLPATPAEPKPPRASEAPGSTMPLGATMPLGSDLSELVRAALPFGESAAPKPPTFPRLPLETYASLCAELAVSPAPIAEILRKYNVADDAARAALEQHWQARLDANPDTKDEWQRLFMTYRDWLAQHAR